MSFESSHKRLKGQDRVTFTNRRVSWVKRREWFLGDRRFFFWCIMFRGGGCNEDMDYFIIKLCALCSTLSFKGEGCKSAPCTKIFAIKKKQNIKDF